MKAAVRSTLRQGQTRTGGGCRASGGAGGGRCRTIMHAGRKFLADWKEMTDASQPQPNPPDLEPPVFTARKCVGCCPPTPAIRCRDTA